MAKGVVEAVEVGSTGDGRRYLQVRVGGQTASLWEERYYDHVRPGGGNRVRA